MNDEGYGSKFREHMKNIMAQPAGFKPMNRVEKTSIIGVTVFSAVVTILAAYGIWAIMWGKR